MALQKQVSVGQAVTALVAGTEAGAPHYTEAGRACFTRALLSCETADVRYRLDGGDPSATVGHLLYTTGTLALEHAADVAQCRLYAPAGTATVFATLS